jgi:predicted permease
LREHPSRERGLGAAIERIRAIAIGRAFASPLPRILAGGVASFAVGLLPHLAPVARDALILQRAMPVAISTWSAGASVPLILGLAIGPTGA